MNHFALPNPVRQVLCGPFTGAGSEAMAVTIGAPTCWGIQHWGVFTLTQGVWRGRPEAAGLPHASARGGRL